MGDRWYDAQLGRWISADTIIPDTANPQAWNRYTYVHNNPLRHIDPSGHCDPDDIGCLTMRSLRRTLIWMYASTLVENQGALGLDDVDILANTCDYAAGFYADGDIGSLREFVNDIGSIFVGFGNDDYGAMAKGSGNSPFRITGLGDGGYKKRYQDGDDQAHHFWFYVELGALPGGRGLSWGGNALHETVLFSDRNDPLLGHIPVAGDFLGEKLPLGNPLDFSGGGISSEPPYVSWGHGRSATDLLLGRRGGNLGKALKEGNVNYSEVGDWIRREIGSGDPGSRPRVGIHSTGMAGVRRMTNGVLHYQMAHITAQGAPP